MIFGQAIAHAVQPGIESAESKVKLWDVAEKLLFRKGEIIVSSLMPLSLADTYDRNSISPSQRGRWFMQDTCLGGSEAKRTGMDGQFENRRLTNVRRQDLHAFLLDNYFILTRDEEQGKHVVVSRVS
jgi:hypothetical protein